MKSVECRTDIIFESIVEFSDPSEDRFETRHGGNVVNQYCGLSTSVVHGSL